ncbi:MAG: ATP-binding cassette domain-containing protein, partial [Actinomycetota bacterium]|nr:ATP-binding cassette domain-containing protein [Actinomycetota bacterium]
MSADFTGFALSMRGISKYFEGVAALADVSLEVLPGEVHALLGENGAGKSTLMSIAAGDLAPDAGTVEIGDATLGVASPTVAKQLGIGVVYQHPAIMPDLSVWENLVLAMPSDRKPAAGRSLEWTRERLREIGSEIDPARPGSSLSPVERTMVEIAKALAVAPKVLLLDEPTAVMGAEQVGRLFAQIREIRDRGTAIVYISHRIPEIREIADRVTILRDGRNQGTFHLREVDDETMLRLIAGRELSSIFPPKAATLGTTVLRCQDLAGSGIEGVSLEVHAGEILGFGGAEGNGQVETIRSLAGLTSGSGVISVDGRDLASPRARALRELGVLYIPGDREGEGV